MADRSKRLWEWWKRFAQRVADVQARLLLTALYFLVVFPVALLLKLLADPLALKRGRQVASRWVPRAARATDLEEARRQS
jgi:hypothetical protein